MRQDVSRFKNFNDYIGVMFPYNDEENAWISGKSMPTKIRLNTEYNLFIQMFFGLTIALFSTLKPIFIYFFRLNLI